MRGEGLRGEVCAGSGRADGRPRGQGEQRELAPQAVVMGVR
jgi:hypothetical protein